LTLILPYIENNTASKMINLKKNWDDSANKQGVDSDIAAFVCPTAPPGRRYVTDYGPCLTYSSGAVGVLTAARAIKRRDNYDGLLAVYDRDYVTAKDVKDGLAYTILLTEDGGRPYKYIHRTLSGSGVTGSRWADRANEFIIHDTCTNEDMDGVTQVFNCHNNNEIYSFHANGCNFLYGDAGVHFHNNSIDMETFCSLFTRDCKDSIGNGLNE
jgi:hypothetical protein